MITSTPHHWDFQVDKASCEAKHHVPVLVFDTNRGPDVNFLSSDNHLRMLGQISTAV